MNDILLRLDLIAALDSDDEFVHGIDLSWRATDRQIRWQPAANPAPTTLPAAASAEAIPAPDVAATVSVVAETTAALPATTDLPTSRTPSVAFQSAVA